MTRFLVALATIAVVGCPQWAHAQDETDSNSTAHTAYTEAFELYVAGEGARAIARLKEVARDHPDTPEGKSALRILDVYALSTPQPIQADPEVAQVIDEPKSVAPPTDRNDDFGFGRLELAGGQAINGLFIGAEFCVVMGCDGNEDAFTLAMLAGAGLGFGLMWGLTDETIDPALSEAVNSGTLWGAWQAAAIYGVAGGEFSERFSAFVAMSGQLVGAGGGYFLWKSFQPTPGDIAFGNTIGIWSGVVAGFLHLAFEPDPDSGIYLTTWLASDAGLVTALLLADHVHMSRARTFALDVGGIIGALMGAGVPALLSEEEVSASRAWAGAAIGASLGLGLSVALVAEGPPTENAPKLSLIPTDGGAQVSMGGVF